MNDILLPRPTLTDRLIATGLFSAVMAIIVFFVFGIFQTFFAIPKKRAEIYALHQRIELLQAKVEDMESKNKGLQTAMNFDSLFTLLAKPQQMIDLKDLDDYIKNKSEFCLGEK